MLPQEEFISGYLGSSKKPCKNARPLDESGKKIPFRGNYFPKKTTIICPPSK